MQRHRRRMGSLAAGMLGTLGLVFVMSPIHATAMTDEPTITSISPTVGPVGSTVTITGENFVSPLTITFPGNAQAAGNFTPTQIEAIVPADAVGSGSIMVQNADGTAESPETFTVSDSVAATSAKLTASRATVYPNKSGAAKKVKLTGKAETSTGQTTDGKGSITIKSAGGVTVESWAVKTSAEHSVTWNGKDKGKLKPGKYDATYEFAGTKGKAVSDSVHLVVSKAK